MSDTEALASLSIGIDEPVAAGSSSGYVGRIVDVTPGRAPEERDEREIVIPLGEDQAKTLEIKPGEYIVEAVSPSGELLDRRVSVPSGGGEPAMVRLGRLGRLSGELGWQVVAGNIDRVRAAAENAADRGVREAKRSLAQARSFWRRLGWARPVLLAVALVLAAGATGLFFMRGGGTASAPAQSAPAQTAPVSENAADMAADEAPTPVETAPQPAENAAAPVAEPTLQGTPAAPMPEPATGNMTAEMVPYKAAPPAPSLRRRRLERVTESAETDRTERIERASPPRESSEAADVEAADVEAAAMEAADMNETAPVPSIDPAPAPSAPNVQAKAQAPRPAPAPSAPNVQAKAQAPQQAPAPSAPNVQAKAQAPQLAPAALEEGLSVVWPALLAALAFIFGGLIFTRWARPREEALAGAGGDASLPETAAEAAAAAPVAAPGGLAPTLFRAGRGAAAWAVVDAAEQGLSAVKALLEPVAAKAELAARDCEGFRMYDIAPGQLVAGSASDGPLFAFVPAAGSAGEIIVVPMPWALTNGSEAGFEIAASTSEASTFSAASTVKDAAMTAILGYMAAGRLRQAEILVRDAKDLLNFKYTNPMAAALGAYVLLASCGEPGGGANWRPWIGNLCADFDWLPDGAILQGWNLLQQQAGPGDVDQARACFLDAVDRGVPIFSEGIRMLQSGLAFFGGEGAEERVKQAIGRADQLAMRCAPAQAFTTIRVSADP